MESRITPTIEKIKNLLYNKSQGKAAVHVDQPIVEQYDSLLELVA
jgi:hypothetical protein